MCGRLSLSPFNNTLCSVNTVLQMDQVADLSFKSFSQCQCPRWKKFFCPWLNVSDKGSTERSRWGSGGYSVDIIYILIYIIC